VRRCGARLEFTDRPIEPGIVEVDPVLFEQAPFLLTSVTSPAARSTMVYALYSDDVADNVPLWSVSTPVEGALDPPKRDACVRKPYTRT
jgi:hypothetical protein